MAQNVIETTPTPVRVTFSHPTKPPYPNGKTVQFKFAPNGGKGEPSEQNGITSGGACVVDWEPPRLDDDEKKREMVCTVKIPADANMPPQQLALTIWPKTIKVIAKDARKDYEDQPVRHATFTMTANGKTRDGVTNENGEANDVEVPDAGALDIKWKEPWALEGQWKRPDARTWDAKVKASFKVALVWPKAGTHAQWVNLPVDGQKPEQGSDITVTVKPVPPGATGKIYVLCEFHAKNSERNDPKPKVHAPAEPGTLESEGEKKHKLTLELGKNPEGADEVSFRVELGKAGGDRLTITASPEKDVFTGGQGQKSTVYITNERKIFYQVTTPDIPGFPTDIPETVLSIVKSEFQKVNVEFEKFHERRLTLDELRAMHPGMIVTGDRIDEARKDRAAFVVDLGNKELARKFGRLMKAGKGSLGCQIVLADGFYKPGKKVQKILEGLKDVASAEKLVDLGKGHVFRTSLKDASVAIKAYWGLADFADCPRDHAVVSRHPQAQKLYAGEFVELPQGTVLFAPKVRSKVKLKLPDGADGPKGLIGEKGADKWPIVIVVNAELAENLSALGQNYGSITFMDLGLGEPPAPKCAATTLMHELVHAMGQTVVPADRVEGSSKGLFVGQKWEDSEEEQTIRGELEARLATAHCTDPVPGLAPHPHSYIGKGHCGPHCAAGPTAGKPSYKDESNGKSINGLGTCIMFGAGSSSDDSKAPAGFCVDCRRYIKAAELDSISKIWATEEELTR